ncbi:MAG: hypothetical protein ACTSPB_00045 [Candidatus Thorarchaeota archaeon]
MVRKKHIKFGRCPVGVHCGERWEKLGRVVTSMPVVLRGVRTAWNYEFFEDGVMFTDVDGHDLIFDVSDDTFKHFDEQDWINLMKFFYGREDVFGVVLLFSQPCDPYMNDEYEVEYSHQYFTTFRAYDVRKHTYYEQSVGKVFYIEETEYKSKKAETTQKKLGDV